jgi:hypothetical protein
MGLLYDVCNALGHLYRTRLAEMLVEPLYGHLKIFSKILVFLATLGCFLIQGDEAHQTVRKSDSSLVER